MNQALTFIQQGGVVMVALLALSLVLYYRCLSLILSLRQFRARSQAEEEATGDPSNIAKWERELQDAYDQNSKPITALIAAAPLLGLLGTVGGMIATFNSLSASDGARSFEGLASGISLALTTTETGLAVAIPALILSHLSRRELQRCLLKLASQ